MNVTLRNKLERKYKRIIARALRAQWQDAVTALSNMPAESVLQTYRVPIEPMQEALKSLYKEVGLQFSWQARNALIRAKAYDDGWEAYFEQFILEIISRRTAQRVTSISLTTQRLIRESIERGISEGLGIQEIARNLLSDMENATAARARTIAQTETISASNQAAFEGANSTGIEYKKFWSTSGLQGIRESHQFAEAWSYSNDGIKPNEKFDMGNGNFMMHPGDPEAPAEEVINCRCSLIIEPV